MLATGAARYECWIKQYGSSVPVKIAAEPTIARQLVRRSLAPFYAAKRYLL